MAVSQKLQNLEKKFGMAEELVNSLDGLVDELCISDIDTTPGGMPAVTGENLPAPAEGDESIICLQQLKGDFQMIRNNIIVLINTGQRFLTAAGTMDLADLKASQLDALSNLQRTISDNAKRLLEIYKDLADIEKTRNAGKAKTNAPATDAGVVNTGNMVQNNIVFQGSTKELMALIESSGKVIDAEKVD